MEKIEYIKMNGLGNDFVVIDQRNNKVKITEKIINILSDRNTGPGCDQLITINNSVSSDHDAFIEIFNPNGDSAEACGNGARCVAKLLFKEKNTSKVQIQSLSRTLEAHKVNQDLISVNMGKLSHHWQDIPLTKKVDTINMPIQLEHCTDGVAVNIGNPHLVFFSKNLNLINLNIYGPQIENHELFPQKTNVEIVEIINNKTIRMKVWERGAGITLACGSGACAAVYASTLKKYTEENVEVRFPEGSLQIKIKDNQAIMTGPAEINYKDHLEI